jgi:L-histidine N-alpha-methyltransferase
MASGGTAGTVRDAMLDEVLAGLARPQKELSPKWFYDARGSALFDEITELPEYYLTRTERRLLETFGQTWIDGFAPMSLVELGAGSADKTRLLLDAMPAGGLYVPVDISPSYLDEVASRIGAEYPHLRVRPAESDISIGLEIPHGLPGPVAFAFLGSTIGNFDTASAHELLTRVRRAMAGDDRFLMGVDLRKSRAIIEAAYNDSRGVTADFNLNVLRVLNRELGADFDLDAFRHRAFYDERLGRIEMHLVATSARTVSFPDGQTVRLAAGESIRTEISCKHDRASVTALFANAGLGLEVWTTDPDDFYALVVGRARS